MARGDINESAEILITGAPLGIENQWLAGGRGGQTPA
jgi:hypothetical protein